MVKKSTLTYCFYAVLTAIMVLSGADISGKVQAAEKEILKIGCIAPLSGTGAGWGLALLAGAELAADEINSQGGLEVAGKRYELKVIPYDDKYKGAEGAAAANRLVFMDKVKFIIGPMGSAVGLAAQEITEPNKVLFVGDSFTTKFLGPKKLHSFRVTMTMAEFSLPMLKWFKKAHPDKNRIAIIGPNDESGWMTVEFNLKAHEEVKHELVSKEFYDRGTVDFMSLLSRMLANKPDVLNLNGTNPGDCGLILKQARQMGFKGLIIKTGGPGTAEMLKVAGPKLMEGFIYYSPINPDDPKIVALSKKYDAKYPPPMNGFMPQFFDGAMWLFKTIKESATVTDTEKIRKAFEKSTYEGTYTGLMTWTGMETYGIDHQVKFPFYVMTVKDGKEVVITKVVP